MPDRAAQDAEDVRRWDGSIEHWPWCQDYAHKGKCLDRVVERILNKPGLNDGQVEP